VERDAKRSVELRAFMFALPRVAAEPYADSKMMLGLRAVTFQPAELRKVTLSVNDASTTMMLTGKLPIPVCMNPRLGGFCSTSTIP
jgi:hypothetical protein